MAEIIFSFIFFILVLIGLSLKRLFGRAPIQGSCGGLSQYGFKSDCGGHCRRPCRQRKNQ